MLRFALSHSQDMYDRLAFFESNIDWRTSCAAGSCLPWDDASIVTSGTNADVVRRVCDARDDRFRTLPTETDTEYARPGRSRRVDISSTEPLFANLA